MSAEFYPTSDSYCDRCVRMSSPLQWHPIGQGMNFLCADCITREGEREAAEESLEAAWKAEGYTSSMAVWQAESR